MEEGKETRCANCERLEQRLAALEQLLTRQAEQVRLLEQKLASAGKDSSTSSKPPSSDVVKPAKPAPPEGQAQRSIGGQPGHPLHAPQVFPPEQVSGITPHVLDCCPDCGHAVQPLDSAPRVVQQIEVRLAPVVAEHHSHAAWCPCCLKTHHAAVPAAVEEGGLVGPGLTSLIAYLKGVCHCSFSTVRKFLKDVAGVTVSRGLLAKVIRKVSDALADPYQELLDALPSQGALNVDETGHKDNGNRMWTWCFRASLFTLFKIEPGRDSGVLLRVLGEEFDGVIGCDHFSAYRKYMRTCDVTVQFCLAHLIREVKFLTTLPGLDEVIYGTRLLRTLKGLFGVIHRRDGMTAAEFDARLGEARDEVIRAGTAEVPDSRPCQAMAKRLTRYGADYFRFITSPGLEPTNNLAEQAIRFVVIDRLVTQGTRGEAGRGWSERIWSVMATCAQQGRSVFAFISEAVTAHFEGGEKPSLAPR